MAAGWSTFWKVWPVLFVWSVARHAACRGQARPWFAQSDLRTVDHRHRPDTVGSIDHDLQIPEIFVPGGQPSITYVARSELGLESRVRDYLGEGHRMLSVAGSTKSGKTVLVKSIVRDALWVMGGNIHAVDDLWEEIVDRLGAFASETKERAETTSESTELGGHVGLNMGVKAGGEATRTNTGSDERRHTATRSRRLQNLAIEQLVASGKVLAIDDFHYIPRSIQGDIVRGLKGPIFDGLRVIVCAVPHRSFDAVRVEREMTGRVEHLHIPSWTYLDLLEIPVAGFKALNLVVDGQTRSYLTENSFGSPHLMQDFCLHFCKRNEIRKRFKVSQSVRRLSSLEWERFFQERVAQISTVELETRARLNIQDQVVGDLREKSGNIVDIYGAILDAIAATGPKPELTIIQLHNALRELLADGLPSRAVVAEALERMTEEQRGSELMLDYDAEYEKVFIADPFYAFVLRWGRGGRHSPHSF